MSDLFGARCSAWQTPPDQGQALHHRLVSEVTLLAGEAPLRFQSKLAESITEFPQIFEGNYVLISIHITRDVTRGRK